MTTTSRLDEIAQRQRQSRTLDLAFAILIALLVTFQITGLRSAVAKTNHTAAVTHIAPAAIDAAGQTCAAETPVC